MRSFQAHLSKGLRCPYPQSLGELFLLIGRKIAVAGRGNGCGFAESGLTETLLWDVETKANNSYYH
jgi:hypothetical protein